MKNWKPSVVAAIAASRARKGKRTLSLAADPGIKKFVTQANSLHDSMVDYINGEDGGDFTDSKQDFKALAQILKVWREDVVEWMELIG